MGGNDTIRGSNYNDDIDGGEGNDTLYGHNGNDGLDGGNGVDYLYGESGNDWLHGGNDDDFLYGGTGNDWLWGDNGNDYAEGGSGDDVNVAGNGNDGMFGQAGDDILFGEAGADILDGGAGNDRLWGGSGMTSISTTAKGLDYVNDGVATTGVARLDATYDTTDRLIVSYTNAEIVFVNYPATNDLLITSAAEAADAIYDTGVIVQNYFAGGHYVVDILQTADGTYYLTDLIPISAAA